MEIEKWEELEKMLREEGESSVKECNSILKRELRFLLSLLLMLVVLVLIFFLCNQQNL